MTTRSNHPHRDEIDRVTRILMNAWALAESKHSITKYPVSYIATFVDMARAVVEDRLGPPKCGRKFPEGGYYNTTCTLPVGHDGDCAMV